MNARRTLLALCLILSSVAVLPTGAGASSGGRGHGVVTHRVENPGVSKRYWTQDRMAAARPAPMPTIQPEDLSGGPTQRGEPVLVEGVDARSTYGTSTDATMSASATSTPIPFERFQIDSPATSEFAKHGALFFTSQVTGLDYACSGTVINSDNESVVWTAGHCLYEQGLPSLNLVFVPGYENRTRPLGTWAADQIVVPTQWQNNEDLEFDFGAFRTRPNESGTLVDVVGGRGIAFNQHPTEALQSFGYPAFPMEKFDGEHLQTCVSNGSGRIAVGAIAMGCDMEQGSSGGGWVMRGGYVMSNVSGGNMEVWPNMALGPYLGNAARNVFDQVRGGTSEVPQPEPTGPVTPDKTHTMKITLRLRYHLVASGRITATDGFSKCAQTVPFVIAKLRASNNTYYPVGGLRYTKADGTYRVKLRDRTGRYAVFADESPYDNSHNCAEAYGFARHRHG